MRAGILAGLALAGCFLLSAGGGAWAQDAGSAATTLEEQKKQMKQMEQEARATAAKLEKELQAAIQNDDMEKVEQIMMKLQADVQKNMPAHEAEMAKMEKDVQQILEAQKASGKPGFDLNNDGKTDEMEQQVSQMLDQQQKK